MDLEKKREEVDKIYQEKRNNLNQLKGVVKALEVECINLEGQLQILNELKEDKGKKN